MQKSMKYILTIIILNSMILMHGLAEENWAPIVMDDITTFMPYEKNTDIKLLFKSGFESNVYIDSEVVEYSEDYRFIRGSDESTGFAWPLELFGSSESALHYVASDDFNALHASIDTVMGHNNTDTEALYNQENYREKGDTQLTYEILNITKGNKDLYVRYWMKIASSMQGEVDKWRALFEYKTEDYKDPGENGLGYRLISFIYSDTEGRLSWHMQGDKDSSTPVWECDSLLPTVKCGNMGNVPDVIIGDWFLVEYYWHWSNDDDGLTWWKVNGEMVAKNQGPTTRNNQPLDFILFTQLYGNVTPKAQWIDDIEVWSGVPDKYK